LPGLLAPLIRLKAAKAMRFDVSASVLARAGLILLENFPARSIDPVTVEIKTGKRRLIEYLMSPLLRYRQESLRER
jgi:hypothetical protein